MKKISDDLAIKKSGILRPACWSGVDESAKIRTDNRRLILEKENI